MKPLSIKSLVLVALVVLLAACTAESVPEESVLTTIPGEASDEPLVFGSGSIPATVPADFPIPSEARVGSTMVDSTRGVTEFIIVFPAGITEVVEYFGTNLPATGYTVDESSGSGTRWVIEFSRDGLDGNILVEVSAGGVSQGTIRVVQPVTE
ncbi:MAG TPA: hypothetical protein VLA29_04595 [Acidimicrobiia bacterium]|nr:hypothetical protein [Acidimicrobiia bacterium]